MITQGLLLWPYVTFARLIAPYVVAGKAQEYKPEAMGAILAIVACSTLLTLAHLRGRSSRARTILVVLAALLGVLGLLERLSVPVIGVVR